MAPTDTERITGGMWGLLVGDAVGVPYEFKSPDAIPSFDQIDLQPPPGYPRSHVGVPPGTWSDDGARSVPTRNRFEASSELL